MRFLLDDQPAAQMSFVGSETVNRMAGTIFWKRKSIEMVIFGAPLDGVRYYEA
jgi:hypothetical protein